MNQRLRHWMLLLVSSLLTVVIFVGFVMQFYIIEINLVMCIYLLFSSVDILHQIHYSLSYLQVCLGWGVKRGECELIYIVGCI